MSFDSKPTFDEVLRDMADQSQAILSKVLYQLSEDIATLFKDQNAALGEFAKEMSVAANDILELEPKEAGQEIINRMKAEFEGCSDLLQKAINEFAQRVAKLAHLR